MASIFSKIIAGDIPSYKVAENDDFFAFLDINPMAEGHTLVVPKSEVDYIFDLPDDLYLELMAFSKKVGLAIEKTISCNRIGILVFGLEVPHAHVHLIPINEASDMSVSKPKLSLPEARFKEIAEALSANMVY